MRRRSKKRQWLISAVHGVVLLLIGIAWTSTKLMTEDETVIVKWSSGLRNILFRKPPEPKDFLFIDVAHDQDTISSTSGSGIDVVTDRKKLAIFFNRIEHKRPPYRFMLCDIFFEGKSRYDQELISSLRGLPRVAAAAHMDEDGEVQRSAIVSTTGITTNWEKEGLFTKFQLFESKQLPTMPVLLYERLSGRYLSHNGWFCFDNDALCFNHLIVDMRLRNFSVFEQRQYAVFRLAQLSLLSNQQLQDLLNNRIVVIGDFERDQHYTVTGRTAGPLILINCYLSLVRGQHLVSWVWLLFMLVGLILFAKMALYHRSPVKRRALRWLGPFVKDSLFLSALSVLSYVFFDHQFQVLLGLGYIYLVQGVDLLRSKPLTWNHLKTTIHHVKERIEQ